MTHPSPPEFLSSILSKYTDPSVAHPPHRPFVTLTFAQSLDAKIAGQNGKQLILSGKESMMMTHWYTPAKPQVQISFMFVQDAHDARWHTCRNWYRTQRQSPTQQYVFLEHQQPTYCPSPSTSSPAHPRHTPSPPSASNPRF